MGRQGEGEPTRNTGILRKAGRVAMFPVRANIWVAKNAFGVNGTKALFAYVSRLWALRKHEICPKCGRGRLFPMDDLPGVPAGEYVGCQRCDHYQRAVLTDVDQARIKELLRERWAQLSPDDLAQRKSAQRWISRACVAMTVLDLAAAAWIYAAGGSLFVVANCLAFAVLLLVYFLRAGYRYAQLDTGAVGVSNGFRTWVKGGRWFV